MPLTTMIDLAFIGHLQLFAECIDHKYLPDQFSAFYSKYVISSCNYSKKSCNHYDNSDSFNFSDVKLRLTLKNLCRTKCSCYL